MVNWLCHVTEPSTNGIFEMSMVVPLTHGVDDAVSVGANPDVGQRKSVFLAGMMNDVPPGAVVSVVGYPCGRSSRSPVPSPPIRRPIRLPRSPAARDQDEAGGDGGHGSRLAMIVRHGSILSWRRAHLQQAACQAAEPGRAAGARRRMSNWTSPCPAGHPRLVQLDDGIAQLDKGRGPSRRPSAFPFLGPWPARRPGCNRRRSLTIRGCATWTAMGRPRHGAQRRAYGP